MKHIGLTAALLSVVAWGTMASAQARGAQQGNQQQMRTARQQGQDAQARRELRNPVRVDGRITAVRTIQLCGDPNRHVLARIRTDRGNVVVDMGTVEEMRNLRLRRNQQVSVLGRPGRINERPVVFANRLRAGGQAVAFARVIPLQFGDRQAQLQPGRRQRGQTAAQRQTAQRMARQNYLLSGEVVETRQVTVQQHEHKHTLAKLRTAEGRTVVVDLGPAKDLKTKLDKGKTVAVIGKPGRINERPVLLAEALTEVERIDRTYQQTDRAQTAAQQEQRQQQQQAQRQQKQEQKQQEQQANQQRQQDRQSD